MRHALQFAPRMTIGEGGGAIEDEGFFLRSHIGMFALRSWIGKGRACNTEPGFSLP
jgi:hypothetical protein